MKFNIYSIWIDYTFYVYVLIFLAAVFGFLYAIRKLMSCERRDNDEQSEALSSDYEEGSETEQLSLTEEKEDILTETSETSFKQPDLFGAPKTESEVSLSPAETFIKNISDSLVSINERLKTVEKNTKGTPSFKPQSDFTLKFLEDIISDYDSLDKEKIKARIQYIISDLKK